MKYIFPGVLCKANCNLEPLAQLAKSQFCMTKKKKTTAVSVMYFLICTCMIK